MCVSSAALPCSRHPPRPTAPAGSEHGPPQSSHSMAVNVSVFTLLWRGRVKHTYTLNSASSYGGCAERRNVHFLSCQWSWTGLQPRPSTHAAPSHANAEEQLPAGSSSAESPIERTRTPIYPTDKFTRNKTKHLRCIYKKQNKTKPLEAVKFLRLE